MEHYRLHLMLRPGQVHSLNQDKPQMSRFLSIFVDNVPFHKHSTPVIAWRCIWLIINLRLHCTLPPILGLLASVTPDRYHQLACLCTSTFNATLQECQGPRQCQWIWHILPLKPPTSRVRGGQMLSANVILRGFCEAGKEKEPSWTWNFFPYFRLFGRRCICFWLPARYFMGCHFGQFVLRCQGICILSVGLFMHKCSPLKCWLSVYVISPPLVMPVGRMHADGKSRPCFTSSLWHFFSIVDTLTMLQSFYIFVCQTNAESVHIHFWPLSTKMNVEIHPTLWECGSLAFVLFPVGEVFLKVKW